MENKIKKHIRRRKAEGAKKEVIIKELVDSGWSLEQATRAFVVNRSPVKEVNRTREKITAIIILSLILTLIGGMTAYWLIDHSNDDEDNSNGNSTTDIGNTNASGAADSVTEAQDDLPTEVAAVVDGTLIMNENFQKEVNSLIGFYSKQTTTTSAPSREIIEKTVLSTLIKRTFMEDRATSLDVDVTEEEIDNEYNTFVEEAGGEYAALEQLQSLYSWSAETFKTQVLKPYLVRKKLEALLVADETIRSLARQKADAILQKVQSEEQTFESLADEYSQDGNASSGGDIGFIKKGETVQEFEDVAFSLAEGETSDLVETTYGFHIIKALEVTKNGVGTVEQVKVAHILIRFIDIDQWVIDQLALKSVIVAVGGYEWKSECGLVLDLSETCENNNLTTYIPDELVEEEESDVMTEEDTNRTQPTTE